MEIKIKTEGGYRATIEIDGRVLTVTSSPIDTQVKGMKDGERESTLGGLMVSRLFDDIGRLLDVYSAIGWERYGTWDQMSEEDSDYAYDLMA